MSHVFTDLRAYRAGDIAGTHKSTAGSQPAAAIPDASWAALERDGYVVFESVLDAAAVAAIRDDVLPRLAPPYARNNFEGLRTQRLYNVVEKTSSCNALIEHPLVLALVDRILEPNYLLSQLQVINILPGEVPQPLHHDDAFYPWPRPRRSLGVAAIWAIDAFTADNGATIVIPGSQLWDDRAPDPASEVKGIVMPPGSVVFFHGTLWHGGGANRSDAARLAVAAQYCAPFLRTQENFGLSMSRDRVRQCSEHVQRLLGYSIYPPFMGFVDGVHPGRSAVASGRAARAYAREVDDEPLLSPWQQLTRYFQPRDYVLTRWLVLRLLGVVYTFAFLGLVFQGLPLLGEHGLTPIAAYLDRLRDAGYGFVAGPDGVVLG